MAASLFGDFVKGAVDVEREILALDAELHSELEALLMENGSNQRTFGASIFIQSCLQKHSWNSIR